MIRLFDADEDGTLSEEEIAGAAAKLKEYDKNKDGELNDGDNNRSHAARTFFPGRHRRGRLDLVAGSEAV